MNNDLFKIEKVVRINKKKKRSFRIIFPLDGVKDFIDPKLLAKSSYEVLAKIPQKIIDDLDYFIALDRGGIILGETLSLLTDKRLKIAWKHNLEIGNKSIINDPYISDEPLYAYGLKPGDKVIVVDDEVYTGDTLLETIKCLKNLRLNVIACVAFIDCRTFGAEERLKKEGVYLFTYKSYDKDKNID